MQNLFLRSSKCN